VPAGDGALSLRVWLDVYIVTGQQLAASPNVVPQGATTPAGRMVATFVVSMSGERLTSFSTTWTAIRTIRYSNLCWAP
jgi:hypothetical protein